jgi:hypothetical protein
VKHQVFYEVAAQVIPVLWIVMVFQVRVFGRKTEEDGASSIESDETHRQVGWVTALVIAITGVSMWVGEGAALNCLLAEEDTGLARGILKVALTLGVFWVFFIPTFPWVETLLERTPLESLRQRWFRWLESRRGEN